MSIFYPFGYLLHDWVIICHLVIADYAFLQKLLFSTTDLRILTFHHTLLQIYQNAHWPFGEDIWWIFSRVCKLLSIITIPQYIFITRSDLDLIIFTIFRLMPNTDEYFGCSHIIRNILIAMDIVFAETSCAQERLLMRDWLLSEAFIVLFIVGSIEGNICPPDWFMLSKTCKLMICLHRKAPILLASAIRIDNYKISKT